MSGKVTKTHQRKKNESAFRPSNFNGIISIGENHLVSVLIALSCNYVYLQILLSSFTILFSKF